MSAPEPKDFRCIGLACSPSLRRGPGSPFARLMREIEPFFSKFQPDVHAVEGTARAIIEYGLARDLDPERLHCLPPGHLGGLVDLGAAVVGERDLPLSGAFGKAAEAAAEHLGLGASVDCLIYLVDPYDATSALAETVAVKRECVVAGKPFLATQAIAADWFNLLAASEGYGNLLPEEVATALGLEGFSRRSIALVAHNAKKDDMLDFALHNFDFLEGFGQRFGTGTTAGLLNGNLGERSKRGHSLNEEVAALTSHLALFDAAGVDPPAAIPRRLLELSELCAKAERLRERHQNSEWVQELRSGPWGGDLQSGEAILMGLCDAVLFFEDPHSPHEHDADIEVFERAARVSNRPERWAHTTTGVMCLHDKKSADGWAALRANFPPRGPVTLAAAFRKQFGVDLVLPPSTSDEGGEACWETVKEEAASYFINAIVSNERARAGRGQRLRVVLCPGRLTSEIIAKITVVAEEAQARAQELERRLRREEEGARQQVDAPSARELVGDIVKRRRLLETFEPLPGADSSLPAHWRCETVTFAPITGAFGATKPDIEANAHARNMAHLVGDDYRQLALSAFEEYKPQVENEVENAQGRLPPEEIADHWHRCDIILLTAGELDADHPNFFRRDDDTPIGDDDTSMHEGLCKELLKKGAVGHIGGLFVAASEKEQSPFPESDRYDRLGMSGEEIQAVARAQRGPERSPEAILVAAEEAGRDRLPTIVAALNANLVSTFITDKSTASAVLARQAET